ncbi:MAG: hypothetical protein ACYTHJ_15670 [Planctomycetota bacterium]|jgi:hypothetical protein
MIKSLRKVVRAALIAGFVLSICHSPVAASSSQAVDVVARAMVHMLPDGMRMYVHKHTEEIVLYARVYLGHESLPDLASLPLASTYFDSSALSALQLAALPEQKVGAEIMFVELDVVPAGELPWEALASLKTLKFELRQRDDTKLLRQMGRVLAFAVMMADPCHAVVPTCRGKLNRGSAPVTYRASHCAHCTCSRSVTHLISEYLARIRFETRPFPGRTDVRKPIWESLLAGVVGSRRALNRLQHRDGAGKPSSGQPGADEDRVDLLIGRWKEGAVLAAAMLISSWEAAGRPDLGLTGQTHAGLTPNDEEGVLAGREPDASSSADWVGSINSRVIHRGDCAHVRRIAPRNRVGFATRESALAAGRKPCHLCASQD